MYNWKLKQPQELINLGFFYFTEVVAKQVAREGFSGEIKLCLNLNEV
jgi:hypothetical protein